MSPVPRPLLEIRNLSVELRTEHGWVEAVDSVDFSIPQGRTLALVGESGCGKSVTAFSIMRLLPDSIWRASRGQILLHELVGESVSDLARLDAESMRRLRGRRIAMIFQEPSSSLNPVLTIGDQITEVLELHQGMRGEAAKSRARELLNKVGLAEGRRWLTEYPHQLSGGMCQRVMIAMALAGGPSLLIADEPTTALDVKTQKQLLDLLAELQSRMGMSILLITHDLGVVHQMAHEVCIMYAGRIVERAATAELFRDPQHPYTQALLDCLPSRTSEGALPRGIPGTVPVLAAYPTGCRFHPRCQRTAERARGPSRNSISIPNGVNERIVLRRCVESNVDEPGGVPPLCEKAPDHWVSCWEIP